MPLRLKLLLPLALLALLMGAYLAFLWQPRALAEAEHAHLTAVDRHLDSVVEGLIPLLLGNQLDIVYENLAALTEKNDEWTQMRLVHPGGRQIYPFGVASDAGTNANIRRIEKRIVHLDMDLGKLIVTVDMTPSFDKLRRQTNELAVLLFSMVGMMFVTLALALELAVRRPLSMLAEASRKLAAADYEAPLPHANGDEVGTLVESFASMREELRRQKQALREEHDRLLEQIAERERAEAEVTQLNRSLEQRVARRTAALEEANKDLEAFSYSVSHDLRAPLRAIHGFSQIISEEYADKLDGEGRRYLDIVRNNTLRMGQLIDDILAFLRMGRLEMANASIDMNQLVRDVFAELQPEAPGRKLKLDLGDLPPARGDRAMIRQVLVNLLANAIKFSATREEALIEVGGRAGPQLNEYWVKDNGVGFDMRYVNKLFGVFQRLHANDEFPGTGVGLSIVKRVVVRHGGQVRAEGKPDEGASVYFSLPGGKVA